MRWIIEPDVSTFAARVLPWLEADPVPNNLICTLVAARASGAQEPEPGCLWAWLDAGDGQVGAVVLRTPPYPLAVGALPPGSAELLFEALSEHDGPAVPGFSGRPQSVAALAAVWTGHGWPEPELHMAMGMYELTAVKTPSAPGRFRAATEADLPLLTSWMTVFHAGLGEPLDAAAIEATARIRLPRIGLWEDGGQPVSTALSLPPAAGVARIGAVYTPPEQRRHGYASAVTAAVSQRALDSGAHTCMLYTDLANPTSNAIYQAIGYRRIGDSEVRRFPTAEF
ncbi:MAG: hypothetical protein QOI35_4005 [Cryptosporangiaceae bacterium]|nr:hypothetical protein [Cryptosporangiaceae bacterium]